MTVLPPGSCITIPSPCPISRQVIEIRFFCRNPRIKNAHTDNSNTNSSRQDSPHTVRSFFLQEQSDLYPAKQKDIIHHALPYLRRAPIHVQNGTAPASTQVSRKHQQDFPGIRQIPAAEILINPTATQHNPQISTTLTVGSTARFKTIPRTDTSPYIRRSTGSVVSCTAKDDRSVLTHARSLPTRRFRQVHDPQTCHCPE